MHETKINEVFIRTTFEQSHITSMHIEARLGQWYMTGNTALHWQWHSCEIMSKNTTCITNAFITWNIDANHAWALQKQGCGHYKYSGGQKSKNWTGCWRCSHVHRHASPIGRGQGYSRKQVSHACTSCCTGLKLEIELLLQLHMQRWLRVFSFYVPRVDASGSHAYFRHL